MKPAYQRALFKRISGITLGLAYYLQGEFDRAVVAFQYCFDLAANDDMRVAAADWLYMSLRRDSRAAEASDAIDFVSGDIQILENQSYLNRLLMYRGSFR